MPDGGWNMQEELAATLAEMKTRFGDGAFTSRRRLLSLLADRLPGANREIKVLALALEDGAVEALANAGGRLPIEIDRLCAAMEMRHGVRADIARPVLVALAHGLGLADIKTASASGTDDDWLGASSIVAVEPETSPDRKDGTKASGKGKEQVADKGEATGEGKITGKSSFAFSPRLIGLAVAIAIAAGGYGYFAAHEKPTQTVELGDPNGPVDEGVNQPADDDLPSLPVNDGRDRPPQPTNDGTAPQGGLPQPARTDDGQPPPLPVQTDDGQPPRLPVQTDDSQPPPLPAQTDNGQPPPLPSSDTTQARMIFPDSDRRRLTDREVAALGKSDLRIARNEIFARHGYEFGDQALREHFKQFPWYSPTTRNVSLNDIERDNVALIQKYERQ